MFLPAETSLALIQPCRLLELLMLRPFNTLLMCLLLLILHYAQIKELLQLLLIARLICQSQLTLLFLHLHRYPHLLLRHINHLIPFHKEQPCLTASQSSRKLLLLILLPLLQTQSEDSLAIYRKIIIHPQLRCSW